MSSESDAAPKSMWIQTATQRTLIEQWLTEQKFMHWGALPADKKRKAHQDELDRYNAYGAPQHYTHVSFRGWWAYVPANKMSTYLMVMAQSLVQSTENDVNEVPWRKRPVYFDIDFGCILDWAVCLRVCRAIQYLLSQMVRGGQPQKYLAMIVAQSDSAKKSNLHVFFPNLVVDIETHLRLYELVVMSMPRFIARSVVSQPWSNIIDRAVILTSLRVLECIKTQTCPCRTSADPAQCVGCRDGKIINSTRYHIKSTLNENGSENDILTKFLQDPAHKLDAVRLTSIWCPSTVDCVAIEWIPGTPSELGYHPTPDQLSKDMKLQDDEKEWKHLLQYDKDLITEFSSDVLRQDYERAKSHYEQLRQHHILKKKHAIESEHDKELLSHDDLRVTMIEQFIQNAPIKQWMMYSHLSVTNVYFDQKRQLYDVYVQGVGMHYCHNVERDHHSASIYFQISRKDQSVVQRCKSRKVGTDRKFGPCLSTRASMVKLPLLLMNKLFDSVPQLLKTIGSGLHGGIGSGIGGHSGSENGSSSKRKSDSIGSAPKVPSEPPRSAYPFLSSSPSSVANNNQPKRSRAKPYSHLLQKPPTRKTSKSIPTTKQLSLQQTLALAAERLK